MPIIQVSNLDIEVEQAVTTYSLIAEADIRSAHGERVSRSMAPDLPEYIYDAAVHRLDEDQKAYEAEIEAQSRAERTAERGEE